MVFVFIFFFFIALWINKWTMKWIRTSLVDGAKASESVAGHRTAPIVLSPVDSSSAIFPMEMVQSESDEKELELVPPGNTSNIQSQSKLYPEIDDAESRPNVQEVL